MFSFHFNRCCQIAFPNDCKTSHLSVPFSPYSCQHLRFFFSQFSLMNGSVWSEECKEMFHCCFHSQVSDSCEFEGLFILLVTHLVLRLYKWSIYSQSPFLYWLFLFFRTICLKALYIVSIWLLAFVCEVIKRFGAGAGCQRSHLDWALAGHMTSANYLPSLFNLSVLSYKIVIIITIITVIPPS